MPKMNGHVKRIFLDGFNVGNFMQTAVMEKYVTDNKDWAIGTNFSVRTRGGGSSTFTKASQT